MIEMPTLEDDGVRLRAFASTDAPLIQHVAADELIPLVTTVSQSPTSEEARAFIARQLDRHVQGVGYSFAVADASTDEAVGQIGLWIPDIKHGRANIGYWIGAKYRRRNYAARALQCLAQWAFTVPSVERLELYVEPWNEGSWRTAEKVGFRREGLLRKWQEVGSERRDMFMYSLLTGERA
jgi:RimJ/RimL family protein N-acetyltransferase